jgi:hypothetical protein
VTLATAESRLIAATATQRTAKAARRRSRIRRDDSWSPPVSTHGGIMRGRDDGR